ncbi:MAG: hemolysin family protein [Actinomycetota bacterium]
MSATQVRLIIGVAAVGVSFLASAWVHAMSRLGVARARRLSEGEEGRARLLLRIAENPRPYLASALLFMLGARITAVVMVAQILQETGMAAAAVITVALMTFVLFEIAEIAPRSWVLERPDQVMLLSARPVYWLGTVLQPVTTLLVSLSRLFLLILPGRGLPKSPLTSEEEIMSILEVAESEEVIETEERQMIHSIFEFGDTVVREVMTPRPDMICVDGKSTVEEVLDTALKHGFSRIPVIRGDIDDILGVVHVRDLVERLRGDANENGKVTTVMREAMFVPESKKVAELLREMQRAKTQISIVVDEYGGTAGLVTMEDLLEEIVGEISDEHDREEPFVEKVDEHTLRVNARLDIDELNDLLEVQLPTSEWDSIGGLVGGLLGRLPVEGDRVLQEDVEFEVEAMNGRRIEKVLVHHPASAAGLPAE